MSTLSTTEESNHAEGMSSSTEESVLTIGNRTIPSRYFLAPLAGYTHLAFRTAIRELGGLGLATTDLVQAPTLLSGRRKSLELIATSENDQPLAVQIYGGVIDDLIRAARHLEKLCYGGIDINMGCPMAKITGRGGGARLMCDLQTASKMVSAVVEAVKIPVTVKMRLGWDRENLSAPMLAEEFERIGVAAITVHGRTRQQGFQGSVDLEGILATVAAVKSIPVIGNGDVCSVADAFEMREKTGCAAVAIGRGALLDPWIFSRIDNAIRGLPFETDPTAKEQIDFLERHFTLMTEQHHDYSCVLFRKFAGWYGARLGIPEDLENRLRRMDSVSEFHEIVKQIRKRQGERKIQTATALIRTPNGPIERW